MKDTINLTSMAAESSAALKKLADDLRDLRRMIEARTSRENGHRAPARPTRTAVLSR